MVENKSQIEVNLEAALSDIVCTFLKIKEIESADYNKARIVFTTLTIWLMWF